MKPYLRRAALALSIVASISYAIAQIGAQAVDPPRLPGGKDQQQEILKAEHERNLKDATLLVEMAEELKEDLEKDGRNILSVATLKKTDEIEKLVRKIRSRLRRN